MANTPKRNHLRLPGPQTELDAVNTILSVIGEAPLNTLHSDDGLPSDVAMAVNCLTETVRQVQMEGWQFNTDQNFELIPDDTGEITIPYNMLRVYSLNPTTTICRGNRLYDVSTHTYKIGTSVTGDVVFALPFNEMPEVFKWYVTIVAARRFQERALGSEILSGFTEQEEAIARIHAVRENGEAERNAVSDGTHYSFINGWDIRQILER